MFNLLKKKKRTGFVVQEEYVPAELPKFSRYTDYVAPEYKLLNPKYIGQFYKTAEEKFASLISKMDKHNAGTEAYGYIRTQISHMKEDLNQDIAWADYQCERIENVKKTRYDMLERKKINLIREKDYNDQRIEPLKSLKAQYEIKLFGRYISLGGIVTVLAMIADQITNFSFLQGIVTMGGLFLFVAVLSMAVMSDCSMSALGILLSKSEENYMDKRIRTIACISLIIMFLLSVVAGPMIRFGSMGMQYGTIDAAGNYIAKESGYTMAEIGITMITSFLTAATGVLSFVFSYDRNREKVMERRRLEKKNDEIEIQLYEIETEQSAIKNGPNERKLDQKKREAAEANLKALEDGLKAQFTRQWAEVIGEPEVIEKAAETVEAIIR